MTKRPQFLQISISYVQQICIRGKNKSINIYSSRILPLDQNTCMGKKGIITDLYGTTLGKASVVRAAQ